jgi:hypothetical protein
MMIGYDRHLNFEADIKKGTFILAVLSVVVVGNFTEEEIEGAIMKTDDHSKEYPLQRDEVQTTPSRDDRPNGAGAAAGGGPSGGADSSASKQYIGLVIGVLTAVILLLMGAIMFIVFRNRRLKSGAGHSVLPGAYGNAEKGVTINMKVSHPVVKMVWMNWVKCCIGFVLELAFHNKI